MSGRQILQKLRLFNENAYINGKWVASKSLFPVYNPATGEVIANVSSVSKDDVSIAISSAEMAFQDWKKTSSRYRSSILKKLAAALVDNKNDLATVMTMECGKPFNESKGEVLYAASFLEWFGEEANRIHGDVLPIGESNMRKIILKQPVGVCAMVTPWNFPLAMITRKIGPAMAAGCTSILKPSEETPLTALAFCKILEDCKVPEGIVNVIPCSREDTPDVGHMLCKDTTIRKISFTGSTAVGKWLLEQSSSTVKRVSLENGGNAPLIVFDSADPKLAAAKTIASRFRNSGQTCICAERIFVQEGIYEEFVTELVKQSSKLKLGNPFDSDTSISAVINQGGLNKVMDHVNDAKRLGGKIVHGGNLKEGLFFEPTIIGDCNNSMKCMQEETFGPVAPIMKFKDEDEVMKLANTLNSGLAGYVFSNDWSQIWCIMENLEVGMVGVNENNIRADVLPFGGIKESGLGREGSIYGINEYLELKSVCFGGSY